MKVKSLVFLALSVSMISAARLNGGKKMKVLGAVIDFDEDEQFKEDKQEV